MSKKSAGILMFRRKEGSLEVFLVHPGGPYWAKKDLASWSIPKGELEGEEDALSAAKREFHEETGFRVEGVFLPLTPLRQRSGKLVSAWAVEGDCDPSQMKSNHFSVEWPPHSGELKEFPEADRSSWFGLALARAKILPGQLGFLNELEQLLAGQ